jgi:hypothetical protein
MGAGLLDGLVSVARGDDLITRQRQNTAHGPAHDLLVLGDALLLANYKFN